MGLTGGTDFWLNAKTNSLNPGLSKRDGGPRIRRGARGGWKWELEKLSHPFHLRDLIKSGSPHPLELSGFRIQLISMRIQSLALLSGLKDLALLQVWL